LVLGDLLKSLCVYEILMHRSEVRRIGKIVWAWEAVVYPLQIGAKMASSVTCAGNIYIREAWLGRVVRGEMIREPSMLFPSCNNLFGQLSWRQILESASDRGING
jgi:hypothetical protein